MADSKISDLTALTTPATGDLIPIVDVSEAAAADKNKSITVGELLRGAPDGTAAAPGIAFESDGGNGMFLGGTDILAFSTGGTQAVTIDASQRVGIGTSSPATLTNFALSSSTAYSSSAELGTTSNITRLHNTNGTDNTGVNNYASLQFLVANGATSIGAINYVRTGNNQGAFTFHQRTGASSFAEHMRIDSSGRLLVNQTSVLSDVTTQLIEATGDIVINSATTGSGQTASLNLYHLVSTSVATRPGGRISSVAEGTYTAGTASTSDSALTFSTTLNATLSEKVRIDSSGRLLVGTPTARTDFYSGSLSANVQVEGSSFAAYSCYATSGNGAFIFGRAGAISGSTIGNLSWHADDGTDEVEAARISAQVDGTPGSNDMPGRLVFSTTTNGASSPTEHARINEAGGFKASTDGTYAGTALSYHELVQHSNNINVWVHTHKGNSTPYGGSITFANAAPDDNTRYFLSCTDNVAVRLRIYSDGDVQNHDNSYGAISDEKLKQDITDSGSQWDDLKNLRVRKFKFKSDVEAYGDEAKTLIGVVAQEVEAVSPGLVKDNPDLDAENNDLGTTTKTVNYSVLYMKAVKALQEAMERIETLEAKVAALESA